MENVTVAAPPRVIIVKSTGEREEFDPAKLDASLMRAGASEMARSEIVPHIEAELRDGMSTSQIYKHAFFLLKRIERPAAVRYSLRRAVLDLGPTGFPFEKFIAEIFREKGFNVATGQIVRGKCVEHEVDIVAWNENKLIMCEAKFHHHLGIKSDAKVALYVKARFDDLMQSTFDYGLPVQASLPAQAGRVRKLDESWLITNTKFSRTAIDYAKCQGMRLVGWNYPAKGNLQDMIEDSGLHPITSLTSLSNREKAALVSQGVILAKSFGRDESLLRSMGFSEAKMVKVIDELSHLTA